MTFSIIYGLYIMNVKVVPNELPQGNKNQYSILLYCIIFTLHWAP